MAEKYLLKKVRVADPQSPFRNKRVDVFIDNGVIRQIGKELNKRVKVIDAGNAIIAPAFCDLYADFCDPGFEHREDIHSGIQAAIKGGYSTVCVIPATNPVVQSKSSVEYIINKAKGSGIDVLPIAAVSEDLKGELPTEMYDMYKAGAIAFSDAPKAVRNSGLLLRALQYVQPFDGVIFDMTTNESLSNNGHLSEGEVSVRMGLKGIPHLAEVIQIKRNIEILRYAGGRLHLMGITTKEGVNLVKAAKKEGLDITASVFVHHLFFKDEDMSTYDAYMKVHPPFRTKRDRTALRKGLVDGVIDCIATQHTPVEIEGKKLEFEYASPGMIGLQSAYALAKAAFEGKVKPEQLIEWLSINPRKIIGVDIPIINEKQLANFVLINDKAQFTLDKSSIASKSQNTPLKGEQLNGKIIGLFNQGKWLMNEC